MLKGLGNSGTTSSQKVRRKKEGREEEMLNSELFFNQKKGCHRN